METPSSHLLRSQAADLIERMAALTSIDQELAELALASFRDAQLAAMWLVLPQEELSGQSPAAVWQAGEYEPVRRFLAEILSSLA